MSEKQPEKSSLIHKILRNNLLIIGFFVVLIWTYATVSLCYNTYHKEMEKHETAVNEYADLARETISTAITHSEHIVRSNYILENLNRADLSVTEMLEFFDHSEEILSPISGVYGTVRIFHTNDRLYEARRFSHLDNLRDKSEICKQLNFTKSAIIVVKDTSSPYTSNVIMYRQIQDEPLCILEYPIILDGLFPSAYSVSVVSPHTTQTNENNYFYAPISNDLTCVMEIPAKEVKKVVLSVFLMCLLILLFIGVLILQISRRTAKKTIREINQFMENLAGEALLYDDKFFHTTYDLYELNIIKKTLQKLALEVQHYAEAIKNAELENKELEMELLSMQLDPHMLYNSLAAIRLDAYQVQHQKIIDLIDNMVLYYRNILKKDRKFISVEQEMESIRKYLYINELSHEKKYPLEVQIAESLTNMKIPPQILHTFVENCIVHGLSGNQKDCLIRIRMSEADGFVITEIFDNGYGISHEMLTKLNSGSLGGRHIGVSNALKRLKLIYGEESSIHFDSEKNAYTKVTIRFPRLDDKEQ